MVLYRKVTVGIFSRESQSTYLWLVNLLLSPPFRHAVRDVRPVALTNHVCGHSSQLTREVAMCNFAILYHTKKRGRLNVTDVTDSLYDEELRHLHAQLGRERVIVLVDDIDTDDSEVYSNILREQPLITQLSGLLVVMCEDAKSVYDHSGGGGGGTSDGGSYQQNTTIRSTEKTEKIKAQIRKAQELNVPLLLVIGFLVVVIVIIIVVVCIEE